MPCLELSWVSAFRLDLILALSNYFLVVAPSQYPRDTVLVVLELLGMEQSRKDYHRAFLTQPSELYKANLRSPSIIHKILGQHARKQ